MGSRGDGKQINGIASLFAADLSVALVVSEAVFDAHYDPVFRQGSSQQSQFKQQKAMRLPEVGEHNTKAQSDEEQQRRVRRAAAAAVIVSGCHVDGMDCRILLQLGVSQHGRVRRWEM